MSKPCLVLDLTEMDQWTTLRGCLHIPELRRPTVLHPSREVAEEEALRLAAAFPGRLFTVFEVVAAARTIKAPTHITLGGKVLAERDLPRLMQVSAEQEDVPF